MKHISTLDVKNNGSPKVKRHTVALTSCKASSNSKGKVGEEKQVSSNDVIVREIGDLDAEVEPTAAPKTLEDEGQAMVNELKKLNFRSEEDL